MNIGGIQITLNIGIQKGSVEDANHWDFIRKEVDFINRKGQKRMDFTTRHTNAGVLHESGSDI